MAERLYDKFADLKALENEKKKILSIFGEVKQGIKELSQLGVKIESSSSIKETTASVKKYQEAITKLEMTQKQYKQSEERIIELREKSAKAAEREAKAKLAEEKLAAAIIASKKKEQKAREDNAAAIEKENRAKNSLSSRDVNDIPFEIKGNLGGDPTDGGQITNLNDQRDALNELQREYAETTAEIDNFNNVSAKLAEENLAVDSGDVKSVTQYKDELEKLTGTIDENEQLQRLYKNELADIERELKLLEKTTGASEKTTSKYKDKVNGLLSAQNALKKESSELALTLKRQTVEQNSANGSLVQLRAKLALATTEYEKMSQTVKESPVGVAIKNQVVALTMEVSKQEQEIGKYQRNVGNYTNKTLQFFKGAFAGLRTISNILPGLGISTLLLLLTTQVQAAFASLKRGLNDAEKATKRLSEVNKEAVDGYIEQKVALEDIVKRIQDENTTNVEKEKILKEVNEKYADQGIQLKNISELEKFAAETAPALAKAFVLKAKAAAAFGLAVKSATKELELQQLIESGKLSNAGTINSAIKQAVAKGKKEAEKDKDDYLKIQKDALNEIAVLEKQFKFDVTPDKKTTNKKDGAGSKGADPLDLIYKNNQDRLKAERDYQKQLLQDKINAANVIIDNEEETYEARKAALEDYYDFSLALIIKNQGGELAEIKEQRKEEIRNAQKDIKNKGELARVLLSIEAEYQVKKKLILAKGNSDVLKLDEESGKRQISVYKAVLEKVKKEKEKADKELLESTASQSEVNKGDVQNTFNKELQLLEESFAKKLISQKEYNKEKLRIQFELNKAIIEEEIRVAKILVDIELEKANASGDPEAIKKATLAKQKLAALEIQLATLVAAFTIKKAEETEATLVEKFTKIKDIAQSVIDVVGSFVGVAADRERQIIQEQIDDLERKKQKEIEVAEQSILNAEERAKAIDRIEKVAAARRAVLEQKQREADTRRARFEKAANIASIVLKTALAVITALSEGDPLTKIPRALAAGAIGAAQLAVAIATPLPKYAKGKDKNDNYEGPAIAGEAGREMRVDKDGRIGLYTKPTLTYVERDTQILPNQLTEAILSSNNLKNGGAHKSAKGIGAVEDKRLDTVINELKSLNKKSGITIVNERGIKSKAWYNRHIKK